MRSIYVKTGDLSLVTQNISNPNSFRRQGTKYHLSIASQILYEHARTPSTALVTAYLMPWGIDLLATWLTK